MSDDLLARDALGRSLSWIAAHPGRARFVEATLGRHAARIAEPELVEALGGFDADDADGQALRVSRMRALLERLGAPAVELPSEARVLLLPPDLASDLPPRPPPAPVVVLPEPSAEPVEVEAVAGDRAREERPEPAERRERGERGERRDREERRGREERGERRGREERRDDRRDREERREDRKERAEEPRPEPRVEARVEPPPEPPPPPTFPLGHPEGSGVGIDSLGVFGPEELEALAAEGLESVADLLQRAPTGVVRAGERWVDGVNPDGPLLVRGRILGRYTRFSAGFRRRELRLDHGRGLIACRWLDEFPVEVRRHGPGEEIGLTGRFELGDEGALLYEGEPLGIDGRGGDWFPTYGLPGVADARMRAGVRAALRAHDAQIADHLPPEVIERNKLMPLSQALRDVHFPPNTSRKGRARMAFDELLQIQLGIALLRARPQRERGIGHTVSHGLVARAFSTLGWYFTDAQEAAFDSIRRDLRRSAPMERLLQGDVGSGKLGVVRAVMTVVAEERQQVFFCAHDAQAAETHWLFSGDWFRAAGIEPLLLTGPPTRTQAEALRKGETLVVFGTHQLYKQPPECKKVGLVVVEQQSGHGVPELGAFEGARPDLLVTTPTPVPALLSLTVYGQLAMTVLGPAAVHGVDVHVLDSTRRVEAYTAAREALARGEQVILAFPVNRGQDLLSPWEARRLGEALSQEALPGARVVLFNGGITREERFRAYEDFQHRRADVLLATATIEDGPIVPNASVLLVEQADKLDLVRMHRLRNHIAAGYRRGKAFFIRADDAFPEGLSALELIDKESDGFRIADLDLSRRGAAEVLGEGAEDVPRFSWSDPAHDRDTLQRARTEAFRLLAADPGLKRRVNRGLLGVVRSRFGEEAFAEGAPPPEAATGGGRRRRRRRR